MRARRSWGWVVGLLLIVACVCGGLAAFAWLSENHDAVAAWSYRCATIAALAECQNDQPPPTYHHGLAELLMGGAVLAAASAMIVRRRRRAAGRLD